MSIIFINPENNRTYDVHKLWLNLTDKIDLQKGENLVTLSNLHTYYTFKNTKKPYENKRFKISGTTWNEGF